MKILKNKRNNYTVELEVEISPSEIENAMDIAFKKVVKKSKIPGFRQGKAPRSIYERHYGRGPIISEAVIDAVNTGYSQAIRDLSLAVVDQPKNVDISEYKENAPIVFSCQVDVKPEVKLGKYKGVKVIREAIDITEQSIDDAARKLQDNHAQFVEIDGPVSTEHLVRLNIKASIAGEPLTTWTRENASIRVGSKQFGESFDSALLGSNKGNQKTFSLSYDTDFNEAAVAGKTVDFDVEIIEIRDKQVPEFNDDFVLKHSNYSSVADFREKTKAELEEVAKDQADQKLVSTIVDAVVNDAKIDVPNGMIQREIDYSIYQFDQNLRRSKLTLDYYLQITQKTIDDMRSDFAESAEKKVRSDLVLEAIATEEKITVSDSDCEAEISKWNLPEGQTLETLKSNPNFNFSQFKSNLLDQKTVAFLKEHAKIS